MLYVIVAIIIIFVLYLIFSKGSGSDYGELLISCDNDKGLADRLINLEKKRKPNISHDEAVTRAINSYRRDRGA